MKSVDLTYTGLLHLDRTVELLTGRVQSDRLNLGYHVVDRPGDLFARQSNEADLELSEMSVSTYLMMLSRGDTRLVGLPVFLSRCFRHRHVYVHERSGIQSPEDLIGKRVGIPEYQMTAGLWSRGFLSDDHEVTPDLVTWVTGPLRSKAERRRAPWTAPPEIEILALDSGNTLENAIVDGSIDALVTVDVPAAGLAASGIRRLFPDYAAVEKRYFERTGVFPIMHILVLRRDIYERDPWLATDISRMFAESRRLGRARLQYDGSLPVALPWMSLQLEECRKIMGEDPFRYGVEASKPDLEVMLRYAREQGITDVGLEVDDLFAPETLDMPMTT